MSYTVYVMQDVTIGPYVQQCTITDEPRRVDDWIHRARGVASRLNYNRPLMVGINEFGNNQASILTLCVGTECLIYQIRYAPALPNSLKSFMTDENNIFAGVNVGQTVRKLRACGLEVNKTVDLCDVKIVTRELWATARETIGFDIPRPEDDNTNSWESRILSKTQIDCACVNTFISYKLADSWKLWEY